MGIWETVGLSLLPVMYFYIATAVTPELVEFNVAGSITDYDNKKLRQNCTALYVLGSEYLKINSRPNKSLK